MTPLNSGSGADPGFLEAGFRCVEEGVRFADFISFFLNILMKMKQLGLSETKLFHFHGIFKNWGQGGGGFEQTPS